MPHWDWKHHPDGVTPAEFQAILALRKKTLEAYADDPSSLLPGKLSDRWGWRCYSRRLGRDLDGSLKVIVIIEGPRGELPYIRKYRLVRRKPLPWTLGQE